MAIKSKNPLEFEGSNFNREWIESIKTESEFVNHPANKSLWNEETRVNKLKELYKIVHAKKTDSKNTEPVKEQ